MLDFILLNGPFQISLISQISRIGHQLPFKDVSSTKSDFFNTTTGKFMQVDFSSGLVQCW